MADYKTLITIILLLLISFMVAASQINLPNYFPWIALSVILVTLIFKRQ